MQTITELLLQSKMAHRLISTLDLKAILSGTNASRYALVNKAIKSGELIQLKRGMYTVNHPLIDNSLAQHYIACQLVPHSYVSFERALSFHQWIPEKVNVVSCALLTGRNKELTTPLGDFQYKKIITNNYKGLIGVNRESIASHPVLMASPVRAFFDLVYVRKIEWQGINFLTDSLRFEPECLNKFTLETLNSLQLIYHSRRILLFIQKMKKDMYPDEYNSKKAS